MNFDEESKSETKKKKKKEKKIIYFFFHVFFFFFFFLCFFFYFLVFFYLFNFYIIFYYIILFHFSFFFNFKNSNFGVGRGEGWEGAVGLKPKQHADSQIRYSTKKKLSSQCRARGIINISKYVKIFSKHKTYISNFELSSK